MVEIARDRNKFLDAIQDVALMWYVKKAVSEQITEDIEKVQQSLLDTFQPMYTEKLTPRNVWCTLSEEDAGLYYEACKKYVAEGPYHVDNPDFCPKLVAQHELFLHEKELIKAICKGLETEDVSDRLYGEKREKFIDLGIRAFNGLFDVQKDLEAVAKEMDKYLKPDQQQRMRKELNLC